MTFGEIVSLPVGADAVQWAALPFCLGRGLGLVFVHSGWGKFRRGISGTGRWMTGLGLPLPQLSARLVATTEPGADCCSSSGWLCRGSGSRSRRTCPSRRGWSAGRSAPRSRAPRVPRGYDLTIVLGLAALALVFLGAGPLSLDALLRSDT